MRILLMHCERFEYRAREKAVADAEELGDSDKSGSFENVLVVFTSVEQEDAKDPRSVVEQACENIVEVASSVKAGTVLIYPYAHLSSSLAGAGDALNVLRSVEESLREKGVESFRAPFGWYKSFTMVNMGHPLAELSRSIGPQPVEKPSGTVKFHRFIIMDEDGVEYEAGKDDWRSCEVFSKPGARRMMIRSFVENELEESREAGKGLSHVTNMRRLELVDYCPESDVGNMKWYPNGTLVKDLIMDYAFRNIALPWGAMKMQNPLLYRTDVNAIRQLQGEFHERDYRVEDEGLVLRFASDPGAFPFMQKTVFTYKNMPVKVYEEAICFRKEQRGELTGLMRVRNFWMTDMHAFCTGEEQASEEYYRLSLLFGELMDSVIAGGNWVLGFEVVEEYYEKHREFFRRIVKALRVPAFFKLMREMTHYYAFKNEFQAIFPNGETLQISTVQWDVKNGERFNICYYDSDGARRPVGVIIHASSFGSVERAVAAMLENAAGRVSQGKPPMLPIWISPEQVRVIPVNVERHLEGSIRVAERLEKEGARVGVDDRDLTVSKRVAEAKTHWIPFIIVYGDREAESSTLRIVVREESTLGEDRVEEMSLEGFADYFRRRVAGMPTRPLYIPRELSRRTIFVPMR